MLEDGTITLRINKPMLNKKPGDLIKIKVDREGNLKDSFYARRLKDAVLDNCVEIIETTNDKKIKKKKYKKNKNSGSY